MSDEQETEFIFALREKSAVNIKSIIQERVLERAEKKGFRKGKCAFLLIGFEGNYSLVNNRLKYFEKLLKSFKTFSLGKSPGENWYKNRFNNPYLRDVLMDYSILVDTLETSCGWENLEKLYHSVLSATYNSFKKLGINGIVTTHLSHVYSTGASLYFIILAKVEETLENWV